MKGGNTKKFIHLKVRTKGQRGFWPLRALNLYRLRNAFLVFASAKAFLPTLEGFRIFEWISSSDRISFFNTFTSLPESSSPPPEWRAVILFRFSFFWGFLTASDSLPQSDTLRQSDSLFERCLLILRSFWSKTGRVPKQFSPVLISFFFYL